MNRIITKFAVIILSVTLIPLGAIGKTAISNFKNEKFVVFDVSSNKTYSLSEREYLIGALFAQTDPSYDLEALKAQAIVSYTNALFMKQSSDKNYDFEIDISREILYIDEDAARKKYADDYKSLFEKIETAVDSVYDKSITFNSKTVLLPFFSSSNGFTEDASVVWVQEVEYLKAVKSGGDVLNPNLKTDYSFTIEEIRSLILEKYKIELPEDSLNFVVEGRTDSGTVTACSVGSIVMTGQDFRSLFGLCSANFDLSFGGEKLNITCYGKGHYVGMSQYGADFMARQGSSFVDILNHYYTNIEIT